MDLIKVFFKQIAFPGVVCLLLAGTFSGCTTFDKAARYEQLRIENMNLRRRLARLEEKSEQEVSRLEQARRELEKRLEKEIGSDQASLRMTDRGLVITFQSEVFFDSGKAEIRSEGQTSLQNIAQVLNEQAVDLKVAVEGHTDNVPIKHSGWKSNWELSTARALSVLNDLLEQGEVDPSRFSVCGYGPYQPTAPNDTPAGRQQNRRVEIIILRPPETGA